jgi:HAD superfamily hydrolase (TIGR01509 family)
VAGGRLPREAATPATLARAEEAYHVVREEAKESGREMPALPGVVSVLTTLGWIDRVDMAHVRAALDAAERACLADSALVPGALDVVAALRREGVRLAVVSSAAYPPFVDWGLARYGLARYFPVIATSGAVGYYKSDPRLYGWALARLGVAPGAAVHVGDHPRFDVAGAQAAGMRAIWLDRPALDRPDGGLPADCRPDAVIPALADLPAALARLARPPAPAT